MANPRRCQVNPLNKEREKARRRRQMGRQK